MKQIVNITLADPTLERMRQEIVEAIRELQTVPFIGARVISNVELEDGVETLIPHSLGRPPRWVRESSPRGAVSTGRVEEVRTGTHNRSTHFVLKATGWGATITLDVVVA